MQENQEQTVKKEKKKKKQKSVLVKASKNGKHYMWLLNVLRIVAIPFIWLVRPFRYYGKRKAPDGACVYVSNHYTLLDIMYIACTTWESFRIIAKKEVYSQFFVGLLARWLRVIVVNRDGTDVRALLDCFKCLKNGEKLAIYPEGTRNKTDAEMLEFKHGASVMAIKTKTPIVPMVLYKKPKFFRMAHILVGEPFEFTEYYDRKLTEADYVEADKKLRDKMLQMRKEHTAYLESKKKGKKA